MISFFICYYFITKYGISSYLKQKLHTFTLVTYLYIFLCTVVTYTKCNSILILTAFINSGFGFLYLAVMLLKTFFFQTATADKPCIWNLCTRTDSWNCHKNLSYVFRSAFLFLLLVTWGRVSVNLQHFSYKMNYLMSIAFSNCLIASEDPVVGTCMS